MSKVKPAPLTREEIDILTAIYGERFRDVRPDLNDEGWREVAYLHFQIEEEAELEEEP